MFSDGSSDDLGNEYENQNILLNRLKQILEALELFPDRLKDI